MRKGTAGLTAAAGFIGIAGGFIIGHYVVPGTPSETKPAVTVVDQKKPAAAPTAARPNIGAEVYKVPVGNAPVRGGSAPKVTIIAFSEFQCPYCGRVKPTLEQIEKTYGKDVQIAFKHFPLSFHQNAMPASIAAEAAKDQGKFWEMHDKLFANQTQLDRPSLEKYAQELGLDMAKFKAALDSNKGKDQIEANMKEGTQFGVRGTPGFFINGHFLRGAQPFDSFKAAIDDELKKADEKLKAGVPRQGLYAALIKDGLDKVAAPPTPPPSAGKPEAGAVYRAEIGNAPIKGAKDALVTIVQYSDYQCPFCSRVEPTIDQIMKEYAGKVRVVWKDLPLPFHQNAMPAAIAARAAGEQGKFWPMHDKLFANQQALDRPSLEKYAQELGLNMPRFKAALDAKKHEADIQADAASGNKIGANGTPAFFINGVSLSGAQPYESFKARIDEELKKAEALVAKGTPKAKVYDAIMKNAQAGVAPAAAQAEPAGPDQDTKVWPVNVGNAPVKGAKNAAITMVVFSDFQCPFCGRIEPTLAKLEAEYPGKIRVAWKNFPLSFHQNAKPAAKAAMAAGEQGKFWEMHDKLFANQQQLDRASLEKYGQELGLNMAKYKAALDSNKFDAQIEADTKEGSAVDVSGTPATFVNGRKIGGAYPYEVFKKVVEQELAKKGNVATADRRRKG